ncbi:MAG: nucleotide exchange factor GrpE [Lachnospiraceae bacterium]|nr:nucleotide exchange factor GrpE [Lachnospiraceae bacterium]
MSKNKKKKDEMNNTPKTAEEIVEDVIVNDSENAEEDTSEVTGEEAESAPEATQEETEKKDEWKDKYTRQLAEFDNFRKRTEKEKSQMYDMGAKTIAERILPTIDNFERGLKNAPDDAFSEGMQMIYKQLLKNLEDAGVKAIECVGKEFDPNIHNAVMHEEDDSGEENIVTEELQKGYMYKDSLLRPSMVKVKN